MQALKTLFDDPYLKWMTGPYCTSVEIEALMRQTCKTCGISDIFSEIAWRFEKRFTVTLGQAEYWTDSCGKNHWLIRYAAGMWIPIGVEARKNTIVHEVCHLAVERLYGHCWKPKPGQERVTDHGKHFRMLMKKCGEDPDMLTGCGEE